MPSSISAYTRKGWRRTETSRGQHQAAETHSSHERGEEDAERDGGGADDQFQELEPDDLVDKRRDAAAEREQEHERERSPNGIYFFPACSSLRAPTRMPVIP